MTHKPCLKKNPSACAHNFLIGIFCLTAVLLCEITFLRTAAWGDDLFIYRDLKTGIYSNADNFISYRYMRHIWTASDGVMAAVVQKGGYEGRGLALYKTLDEGLYWTFEAAISSEVDMVSDGIIDSNNNILLVTSFLSENKTVNVNFVQLKYDSISHAWSINPLTPVTVFASGKNYRATRASIAADTNGVIWCAFRLENIDTGMFQIRVYYSVNGGSTWVDSGNSFGTINSMAQKCAKVIAVGPRIAMIYQDVKIESSTAEHYKVWAYREDSQALQDGWTSGSIAKMTTADGDPYGSHWSVAADDFGNIHLSYEDNGVMYIKYDAASESWVGPRVATNYGNYSSISIAANNDLYLFARNQSGRKIIVRRYSSASRKWDAWVTISSRKYRGILRMSSPERFVDHLPLVYQVNVNPPYQLIYNLLDALP
ncbi:MAG: hypothetical protein WC560_02140 [Syntrophales bacterium]